MKIKLPTYIRGMKKRNILILLALVVSIMVILNYYELLKEAYVSPQYKFRNKLIIPIVDSKKIQKDDILDEIENELPQLPRDRLDNKRIGFNKSCAILPKMEQIMFNNLYWQILITSNATLYIYGAYLDDRQDVHYIRVLTMINKVEPNVTLHGHLSYSDNTVKITALDSYSYIWRKVWGSGHDLHPFLISFKLPDGVNKIPSTISLVENRCDNSTTNIRINYQKPPTKKNVAVCVKGLNYLHEDLSIRLIEWIELLQILGANKVFFYSYTNHPNITKVLNYYQSRNVIDVTPLTLPGNEPNTPALRSEYIKINKQGKRLNELIPYNDCFYKHMNEYKYIVLLDIDEIIIPRSVDTWSELLENLVAKKPKSTSFCARNTYFLNTLNEHKYSGIPEYMSILNSVHRTYNYTRPGQYVKCFHDTNRILTLHNHYPISCLNGCSATEIQIAEAQLNHYRRDCDIGKESCAKLLKRITHDNIVWKYKNNLINSVQETLKNLLHHH